MSLTFDVENLYQFLTQTPEGGLRKMLVDGKPMTEGHFNLMMKVVRHGGLTEFSRFCETGVFPPVRTNAKEQALKETFWNDCLKTFKDRGLLQPATAAKAA